MQLAHKGAREEKLARVNVGLQFAPLACTVIVDTLQTNWRSLGAPGRIDIRAGASHGASVKLGMPEFVRDEQRSVCWIAFQFAADRSALVVVKSPRALQGRITLRQPCEFQFAKPYGSFNESERIERVCSPESNSS